MLTTCCLDCLMPCTLLYKQRAPWFEQFLLGLGAGWKVFNTAGTWPRRARAQLYGMNDMATGKPNLLSMAAGLLIYPVYVVQVSYYTLLPALHSVFAILCLAACCCM